jgi:hypothetical protein
MFFTTGSFRLRLWRREALTRDLGGIHHLSSATALRRYDSEPVISILEAEPTAARSHAPPSARESG